jgi:uncharacterized protein (UPF0335 family)
MKNQDFIKIMENEIVNLQTEYKEIIRDIKKNGYDFNKDRRRAQIDHTISALNIAIKEYNRL